MRTLLLPCLLSALSTAAIGQSLTIPTVTVGNPNNPADPDSSLGAVGEVFSIGKFEVTNTEYAAFLNAVAEFDPYGLYNPTMGTSPMGGILRTGNPGSYSYSVRSGFGAFPVVFVSFWDAARFANWVGTGFTEGRMSQNGPILPGAAYDLNFALTPDFSAGARLSGARVFLPSLAQAYKAAYYHPTSAGGPADSYWFFATRSDNDPSNFPDNLSPNQVNYVRAGDRERPFPTYSVTQAPAFDPNQNYLTEVGTFGSVSESYYGTADHNGNVNEWGDSALEGARLVFGGSWNNDVEFIGAGSASNYSNSLAESDEIGFRVASTGVIPEPGSAAILAGAAALGVVGTRRRRNHG